MKKKTKKPKKPTRSEVQKKEPGLYNVLRRRGLLDKVCSNGKVRNWKRMDDKGLVERAKRIIKEKGIKSRRELQMADPALERALGIRRLTDQVGLPKPKLINWSRMSDDQIVAHAQKVIEKTGATPKGGLTR